MLNTKCQEGKNRILGTVIFFSYEFHIVYFLINRNRTPSSIKNIEKLLVSDNVCL